MNKLSVLFLVISFLALVFSFDKLDHQLFELQDELIKQEGPESNLYKLLKVNPNDPAKRITRSYRKLSLAVHPDKDTSTKATKRFALLSNAHNILKSSHSRERYDFYYKNGFPVWRGTGYMYSRHRPGIAFVGLFLVILSCGTHYLILKVNHYRAKERIEYILEEHMKTLNSRDLKKFKEQIERDPDTPADENILPAEFDLKRLKEPTIYDIYIFRLLGLKSRAKEIKLSDENVKKD